MTVPGLPTNQAAVFSTEGASTHQPAQAGPPFLSPARLAAQIRAAALDLELVEVGVAGVESFVEAGERFDRWLGLGLNGEMKFLTEGPRNDPLRLLPGARSMLVAALPYERGVPLRRNSHGPPLEMAGYARGLDYHGLLKHKLRQLADRCADLSRQPVVARALVDTAPLLEREAARRSGVGFIGKSSMLIAPGNGSYLVLGVLLMDLELPASPLVSTGCGRCTACLDACPTGAFIGPYQLDARRCIAYLTIEYDGVIPRELRGRIGQRVFGCDVCQDVCPYNGGDSIPSARALRPRAALQDLGLVELLELTAGAYRRLVKGSAMKRARRQSLQRNAAVALGNSDWPEALPHLARCIRTDRSDLVRAHACWALGRLAHHAPALAKESLLRAATSDSSSLVREEARLALEDAALDELRPTGARS